VETPLHGGESLAVIAWRSDFSGIEDGKLVRRRKLSPTAPSPGGMKRRRKLEAYMEKLGSPRLRPRDPTANMCVS